MKYKYYVIYSSNGAIQLGDGKVSEWTDITKAIKAYHDKCAVLWNTPDVYDGYVMIIYSYDMDVVSHNGITYKEHITHPQPES